jgi:hypothetical protein
MQVQQALDIRVAEWFIYNRSSGKWVCKGDWRALTLDKAAERLEELWSYPDKLSREDSVLKLKMIKNLGADSSGIDKLKRSTKEKDGRLDWDAVYSELKSKLGIKFYIGAGKTRFVYTVDSEKQVEPVTYESSDSIYDALYSNDEIWRELRDYYASSEQLEPFKSRLTFSDFVKTLIRDQLLPDPEAKLAKEPVTLSWDANEYAFKKIDISKIVPGPTPTWDEFTSRLDYPELFMAWVWSAVEPTNTVRQVCWIRGGGQDGKSAVQKALEHVIGKQQSYSMKRQDLDSQFFLGSVYGKLLITYPDCGYLNLLKHDFINQITGGDSSSVEKKGEQAKSGTLKAKMLVHSNKDPRINPESRFQTTRLLRLILKETRIRDAGFEQRLKDEVWAFLAKCQPMFEAHAAPGRDNIAISDTVFAQMVQACSGGNYLVMKHFERQNVEYGSDFVCPYPDVSKRLHDFQAEQCLSKDELFYVKEEWLEVLREKGIDSPVSIETDDGEIIGYRGFRLKGG